MEPVERFEHRGIGPGLGLDDIEEVACMDEDVRFLFYDLIYCFEEIVVDLLLAEVHPRLRIEAVERGEAKVGVGDVDEVHFTLLFSWHLPGYKWVGVRSKCVEIKCARSTGLRIRWQLRSVLVLSDEELIIGKRYLSVYEK